MSTGFSFDNNYKSQRDKQSEDFTQFLVNGATYESPDVPVLLQILNGAPASQLLPNGSVYPLGANQSVEISFPSGGGGSNTGGPVSL